MTGQTEKHAAMQDAIAAWVADECDGAILDSFVVQACGRSIADLDNDRTQYVWGVAENQSTHVMVGLATMLVNSAVGYSRSVDE